MFILFIIIAAAFILIAAAANERKNMHNIRKIYLYVVSLVALIIIVIGSITLLNMALKAWIFTKADRYASYPMMKPDPEFCKVQNGIKAPPECDANYLEQQKKAEEENRASQQQRDAANSLAMILVGSPVFYFHWRLARKET